MIHTVEQRFSTFVGWWATIILKTQFGNPFSSKMKVLATPKRVTTTQKVSEPPVEKHCYRQQDFNPRKKVGQKHLNYAWRH